LTVVGGSEARTSGTERILLDLEGLSCGACVRRVENALNKIDGVRARVDFPSRVAIVETGPDVNVSDLCTAVHNAGYGAKQRSCSTAESEDPILSRPPGLLGEVIAHIAPVARWLLSPLHR
jgi:copper chaperone CopZ